jgi:hypothetical protein
LTFFAGITVYAFKAIGGAGSTRFRIRVIKSPFLTRDAITIISN